MLMDGLVRIVGGNYFITNPAHLKDYVPSSGCYTGKLPAAAVRPADIMELREIVKLANELNFTLVPVSSGPPHYRGDTAPEADGAVIVDMSRMDKIIRVDPANRVAIIEPGVTFDRLQSELAESGMCAYMPLVPRSSKSVLTSVLEREPVLMPGVHFDSTDPMLCVETVFGTGDTLRTGEAAGPDTLEKQWEIGKAQISPFGPTQMDPQRLLSGAQGTIGIVTWMSVKCRFLSQLSTSFFIPAESLEPLIALTYKLTRIRFTGNIFILNAVNLASLMCDNRDDIVRMSGELPAWILYVSCEGYGPLPEEKVQYLETDLRELSESYGLKLQTAVSGLKTGELAAIISLASSEPYWKLRLRGGFSEIFFLTTLGKTPVFTGTMSRLAQSRGFSRNDTGVYIQPVVQGTSCHCEFTLYHDPANPADSGMAAGLEAEAIDRLEEQGAFFSRPYGNWSDIAYRRSGDTAGLQKKVKSIFDPNWILNPGKLCFK